MIIHLVGAQKSNYPWGFENRLIPALKQLGHDVLETDFRQERDRLSELLQQKADLIIVCKGEGIDPHLIESSPCITSLWYAEQIGTPDRYDDAALSRRKELTFNVQAFDYVFSHDPSNLLVFRRYGAENVFPLPCAAVDPALNRRLDIPKKHDMLFIGSKTTRRLEILEVLRDKGFEVFHPNIWDVEEMNRLFNESRIVLNFHLSDLLNTETRVAEVLGAGSFLLSETLSDPNLIREGEHFASFSPGNTVELSEKLRYYLAHETERETIAARGHDYIHRHHTIALRIQHLIDTIDFSANRRIWPSYVLGVPTNKNRKPTLRLARFNDKIRESLNSQFNALGNFNYSQEWYDNEYHTERLGLDVRTFDDIRTQYEESGYCKHLPAIFAAAGVSTKPIKWLEAACHTGLTAYWAAKTYPDAEFYLFDFSKTVIDWLKKSFPFPDRTVIWQTTVDNIQLSDNDLKDSMDVITCLDVTEHLPDPIYKKMLAEFKRVLKPGGLLILSQGTAPNEEHIHILTEDQIDQDLIKAGFEKLPSPWLQWHFFKRPLVTFQQSGIRPLHIFAAFANVNWETPNLLPALKSFGEVHHFRWDFNDQYTFEWPQRGKVEMNARLLQTLEKLHKKHPIDVFYGYLSGRVVFFDTIRRIRELNIPTVNMCLDDRSKFAGSLEPTGYAGMIDIAKAFNLCWTSTKDALKLYEAIGARAIYLPEGANPLVYKPLNIDLNIDVSFVGQCYGERPRMIEYLRSKGIKVEAFGRGWPSGELPVEEMVQIYNRSRINIGFSMVGNSEDVFCLKGRDFEVPMSGGLYFTQYHPELDLVYSIGKEIVCYHDLEDLVGKIAFYLAYPEKAKEVRRAGYERAIKEHTWIHRFRIAFKELGLFERDFNPKKKCLPNVITQEIPCSEVSHLLEKGEFLYNTGNTQESKRYFQNALSIDPDNVDASNNLAVILFGEGDLPKAITLFSKVLSIDENFVEAAENLGKCHEAKGDYPEALKWFEKALNLNPKSVLILNSIGNCFVQLGDITKARKFYVESFRLDDSQDSISTILTELEAFLTPQNKTVIRSLNEENGFLSELRTTFRKLPTSEPTNALPSEAIWSRNISRLRELVLNGDPREFLRWDVISNTMFVSSAPYISIELEFLKHRPDWSTRWRPAIRESSVGHPTPFIYYPASSGNLIHHGYHVAQFEEKTEVQVHDLDCVFEFGGGYGSICRLLHNLGFHGIYIIFDLAPISALQRYFLKTLGFPVQSVTELVKSRTGIVCVSDLPLLKSLITDPQEFKKTMFIATWSISESPISIRESVLPLMSGFQSFLIAYQNRFGEVDNLDFFESWKYTVKNVAWYNWPIEHLSGNNYLIGSVSSDFRKR